MSCWGFTHLSVLHTLPLASPDLINLVLPIFPALGPLLQSVPMPSLCPQAARVWVQREVVLAHRSCVPTTDTLGFSRWDPWCEFPTTPMTSAGCPSAHSLHMPSGSFPQVPAPASCRDVSWPFPHLPLTYQQVLSALPSMHLEPGHSHPTCPGLTSSPSTAHSLLASLSLIPHFKGRFKTEAQAQPPGNPTPMPPHFPRRSWGPPIAKAPHQPLPYLSSVLTPETGSSLPEASTGSFPPSLPVSAQRLPCRAPPWALSPGPWLSPATVWILDP